MVAYDGGIAKVFSGARKDDRYPTRSDGSFSPKLSLQGALTDALAVQIIGGVNDGPDEQALRVSDDVPFATLDRFTGVKAPWAATFCRFHALVIDSTRAGRSFLTHCFTCHQQQGVVDQFPHTHCAPSVEVMLYRGHGC